MMLSHPRLRGEAGAELLGPLRSLTVRASLTVTLGVLAVAAMTACATSSPAEQALRQRSREAAIVCAKKFPGVDYWWDRWSGALMVSVNLRDYPRLSGDQSGFAACVDAEIAARSPGPSERLAPTSAARTTVHVDEAGGRILAPVTVNGRFHGRFIVDTGASLTLLATDGVRSLGMAPREGAPIMSLQAPMGRAIWRPAITLGSLRVGDVIVEDIEAVVSESVRGADGLLGQNFLRHFRVTIKRGVPNVLLLEARPTAVAPE